MIREDRELLVELAHVNSRASNFALAFLEGTLSQDDQMAFGQKLAALGEAIMEHARQREKLVFEGSVVGLGDATAKLKEQLALQKGQAKLPGVVIDGDDDGDDPDKPPSTGQIVLGDPDCPEG